MREARPAICLTCSSAIDCIVDLLPSIYSALTGIPKRQLEFGGGCDGVFPELDGSVQSCPDGVRSREITRKSSGSTTSNSGSTAWTFHCRVKKTPRTPGGAEAPHDHSEYLLTRRAGSTQGSFLASSLILNRDCAPLIDQRASEVVGSITVRICEIRLAGNPPCSACLRIACSFSAI